jgi:hypothetical protein
MSFKRTIEFAWADIQNVGTLSTYEDISDVPDLVERNQASNSGSRVPEPSSRSSFKRGGRACLVRLVQSYISSRMSDGCAPGKL